MRGLKEVCMVVEFGRQFEGVLGFLEAPEWRSDLRWLAGRAKEDLGVERGRGRSLLADASCSSGKLDGEGEVDVRCVILTRGGEQA